MFSLRDASSAEYSDVPITIGAFSLGLVVRELRSYFLLISVRSGRKEIFAKASPSSHLWLADESTAQRRRRKITLVHFTHDLVSIPRYEIITDIPQGTWDDLKHSS